MDQLDNNKVPRIGNVGEKYRDIQLILQLPKQDLSEEYCKNITTPAQSATFQEFRELRDTNAMDIASVKDYIQNDMVSIIMISIKYPVYTEQNYPDRNHDSDLDRDLDNMNPDIRLFAM